PGRAHRQDTERPRLLTGGHCPPARAGRGIDMAVVHELAHWISEFNADAVTPTALQEAKLHLLDSAGCALAALDEAPARGMLATVRALGSAPDCTIIGTGEHTSVVNATLANGVLVRVLDLNDMGMEPRAAGHCSDNIPVALAVGERLGSSGRDVLARSEERRVGKWC